jgi:hypothetical protein
LEGLFYKINSVLTEHGVFSHILSLFLSLNLQSFQSNSCFFLFFQNQFNHIKSHRNNSS